ncbi:MAG: hypothetical protein JWO11_3224, partial [Nocardioides sp.]|nr:hypothetical protein [Nocardioides sp.]
MFPDTGWSEGQSPAVWTASETPSLATAACASGAVAA